LIRDGGSYACPRSGCLLACPLQPDPSRREGSLVKSAVAPAAWSRTAARIGTSLFAPADRRWACPAWSPSGAPGVAAVSAVRAARPGRLEDVKEVVTGILVDGGPGLAGLTLVVTGLVP
jgi:hypothetical protein